MEDLKRYLEIDEVKLRNSLKNGKLKYLSFLSNDVQYFKDIFNLANNKSELEKFLLYKTAGSFDLYGKVNDADITPPVIKYLIHKLKTIKNVVDVKVGKEMNADMKERAICVYLNNGSKIYLETDTANSLQYDLGTFLRILLKKRDGSQWYKKYMEAYHLPKNNNDDWYKPFKFYYLYTFTKNINQEFYLNEKERKCLEVLKTRAKYTHTFKNMICVPYGYNCFRGNYESELYQSSIKIRDRLDLSMLDLQRMLNDKNFDNQQFQERMKNTKASIDSIQFLLENKDILFPDIPTFTKNMDNNTIDSIILRSQFIIDTLKDKEEIYD